MTSTVIDIPSSRPIFLPAMYPIEASFSACSAVGPPGSVPSGMAMSRL